MDINLELYRVFYYVATTLSFSEASKRLYITQSAVSQSIKTLERKLNHPLFVRSTKKVQLTSEGETLLHHVEPAIRMIAAGENLLTERNSLAGQLRIGASDTICRYYLVDYLKRFHTDYPDVHIRVTNRTSIGCVELLESGQVDFIVCNYPNSRLDPSFHRLDLKKFQDVFAANAQYFPLEKRTLSLEELSHYPLLMLTQKSTTSEHLHRLFSDQGLELHPEVELSSNDLLIDLARIGLGIAFVPDYMLKDQNDLFTLTLKEELSPRQIVLASQNILPVQPAAKKFMEYF